MEDIKTFLRKCDYFGVGFTFNYKSEKTYKSIIGGITFIIFIIISIVYSIISIIEYVIDRPMTVIYYKKQLPEYDKYSPSEFKTGFALKAVCDNVDTDINDIQKLFKIEMMHTKTERINGERIKTKIDIPLKKCEYSDFYNLLNSELDKNEVINDYLCPEKNNYTISGFYLDKIFEYYEITISIINDTLNETLTKLLYDAECKISYFFTDYAIDANNKSNPVRIYLNQNFLQLAPTQYNKLNLFFNVIEFTSYERFVFNFPNEKKYGAYSKSETYELDKGEDRYNTKYSKYNKYATIYIRGDSSRNIFERRLQKLSHLFASVSSPLSCIFMVIYFVMKYLNNIFIVNSVIKTIYRARQEDFTKKQTFREILKNKISTKSLADIEAELCSKSDSSKKEENKDSSDASIYNNPILNLERKKAFNDISAIHQRLPKIKQIINKIFLNNICYIFPCYKKADSEFEIIRKLTTKIYENLDIYNYLKHLQMVKIISYIILNSNEFYLLKYLSNNTIGSIGWGNEDFYHLSTDLRASFRNSRMNTFWSIFEELLNKNHKTSREKKICSLICSDINNLFEK